MPDAELVFTKHTRQGPKEERVLAEKRIAVMRIGGTPPSYNVTAGAHWTKHRKAKRDWQDWLTITLMAQKIPQAPPGQPAPLLRVEAEAIMQFKDRRRRDEGNFRVILEKALGDALTGGDPKAWPLGRWLPDDTPDRYTFGAVQILTATIGEPFTQVELTYYLREGSDAR